MSAYEPNEKEINTHVARHGDGVRDIAFAVENLVNIVKVLIFQFPQTIHLFFQINFSTLNNKGLQLCAIFGRNMTKMELCDLQP